MNFTLEQLVNLARITQEDLQQIKRCRRLHNKLGFGYQLTYVKLMNRFPIQVPFEIVDDILSYVGVQLGIPAQLISSYAQRRETVAEHQEKIRKYCGLQRFGDSVFSSIHEFLFQEACRLEQTSALLVKAEQFLRTQKILTPSIDTLRRLIVRQRKEARDFIFAKIAASLPQKTQKNIDTLLYTDENRLSGFFSLKQAPKRPSPSGMLKLIENLKQIEATGILQVDLSWLNNNLQRSLTRYTQRSDANKMRELEPLRRYAAMVCFLSQNYQETIDHIIDMYDKLINKVYNRAEQEIDAYNKQQRKTLRESLATFRMIAELILDDSLDPQHFHRLLFRKVGKRQLAEQMEEVERWLHGKYSHVFHRVVQRFSYLRQFSPQFIKHIQLQAEHGTTSQLFGAIELLRQLNENNRRSLPETASDKFVPKKLRSMLSPNGTMNKPAWECALLTAIRDEIKAGNLSVVQSKRFGRFDDFFMAPRQWEQIREDFFQRAGLPIKSDAVASFLTQRLNVAFDQFLGSEVQMAQKLLQAPPSGSIRKKKQSEEGALLCLLSGFKTCQIRVYNPENCVSINLEREPMLTKLRKRA